MLQSHPNTLIFVCILFQVIEGSLADRAGLVAGDVVSELCGRNTSTLRHADLQGIIVANGNSLELVVQR
jgi:S1-C subfamily serine protease